MNSVTVAIITIAIGCFVLGTMFGIEYQKVRVQRFWRKNNAKLAARYGRTPVIKPAPPLVAQAGWDPAARAERDARREEIHPPSDDAEDR